MGEKNVTYSKTLFDGGREVDLSKKKSVYVVYYLRKKLLCCEFLGSEKFLYLVPSYIYVLCTFI